MRCLSEQRSGATGGASLRAGQAVTQHAQNGGAMNDTQLVKILGPWKRRHPLAIAVIAIVDGIVLVALAICLIAFGIGGWVRFVLLILGAVWAFYGAYRFPRAIRATQNTHD